MRTQREDEGGILPRLAAVLSGRKPAGEKRRVTQAQAREILLAALAGVRPGSPLPSMRALSLQIGTTPVTIHRVVAALVREGILESQARSGVFTAGGRPEATAGREGKSAASARRNAALEAAHHPVSTRVRFASDACLPHQVAFWERMREAYRWRMHAGELQFLLEPDSLQRDGDCDCFSRHAWSDRWADAAAYLNPEPFLHGDFAWLNSRLGPRNTLVLEYRASYLFLNQPMCQALGLPAPTYRGFADQLAYLRALGAACREARLSAPVSAVYPVVMAGSYADSFLRYLRRGGELSPDVREALGGMVALARLFQYRHSRSDHLELFLRREVAAFAGNSDHFWRLQDKAPEFPCTVYPLLGADDCLILHPLLGAVSRHTQYPLECLKFLALLAEEDEAGLTPNEGAPPAGGAESRGAIPATRRVRGIRGCPLSGEELGRMAEPANPFLPANNADIYLLFNILNGEIWPVIEGRRDFGGILPAARGFAEAYLSSRSHAER